MDSNSGTPLGVRERMEQDPLLPDVPSPGGLGDAAGMTSGEVSSAPDSAVPPQDGTRVPPGGKRLRTTVDADQVNIRIDRGITAAGEDSVFAADLAYGAFQRGHFLTAFSLALDRAQEGDPVAQTLMGELLSRGLGVKQDLAAAADWYGLAAKGGDAEALYALGRFTLEGIGTNRDPVKAAGYLEAAGKKGHGVAAREFAYMLLQGLGLERNAMLGAAYMRRAAAIGDMDAQFALAGLYVEGVGVVADDAHAARWFAQAARAGHVGAQVEYAIMLFNGRGVDKNEARAAEWLRAAATADNPLAQVRLARLLAEGRGVERSSEDAARWYLISKQRGVEDEFMNDWLTRLDKPTLDAAMAAADLWAQSRGEVRQAATAPASDATVGNASAAPGPDAIAKAAPPNASAVAPESTPNEIGRPVDKPAE